MEDETSGHLQTLYCVLGDFSKRDKLVYDRQAIHISFILPPQLISVRLENIFVYWMVEQCETLLTHSFLLTPQ
jgi:hypothetical protein